jgi:hypothetical protein
MRDGAPAKGRPARVGEGKPPKAAGHHQPAHVALGGAVVAAATFVGTRCVPVLVVLTVQVVSPGRVWPWLRLAASLAHRRLNLRSAAVAATPPDLQHAAGALVAVPAALLEPLSTPALFFLLAPPLLSRLAPPVVRTAVFYRHLVPVVCGYLRTLFLDAPATLKRSGREEDAQAVWDARHEWGAQRVHAMLEDLSGAPGDTHCTGHACCAHVAERWH